MIVPPDPRPQPVRRPSPSTGRCSPAAARATRTASRSSTQAELERLRRRRQLLRVLADAGPALHRARHGLRAAASSARRPTATSTTRSSSGSTQELERRDAARRARRSSTPTTGRRASPRTIADEVAPAHCDDARPREQPGCDLDPRDSTPLHLGEDLDRAAARHPHVIAWVAGPLARQRRRRPSRRDDGRLLGRSAPPPRPTSRTRTG